MTRKPLTPTFGIEPGWCARYARLAAEYLSGAKYTPADAWEFADKNNLVLEVTGHKRLIKAIRQGLVIPDKTLVMFYNPNSRKNLPGRKVTHAGLFRGGRDSYFSHLYAGEATHSLDKMVKIFKLVPRQITAPKE